ncbi:MAG: diguanylate cyclase [Synechococcales cyanobacterium CRU_2_2]|nr:diguanylate cyclase [Synechococcales cyanobacterium CRU_2_2]
MGGAIGLATIICVDDDASILACLGEQLKRQFGASYDVELASQGPEALELVADLLAEGVTIPLILSDQVMPKMSGDQFLIEAQRLVPQALKILLTGEHRAEAVGNAVNHANLYRYIAKPWDETDLLLTVQEALRSYDQRSQLEAQQQHLAQINQQLAQSLSTLQATLEATADSILVLNQQGHVINFNQKLLGLLGIQASCLDRQQWLSLIQARLQAMPELWQMLQQPTIQPARHELTLPINQTKCNLECSGQSQVVDGGVTGQVWSFRDVTSRKQSEALIHYQAHHDGLTGLANRVQFDQYLAHKLSGGRRSQEYFAILFVDLDHFKLVNDTLGHAVGDGLLCQVVQRLQDCSRHQDLIARWGGDEFTLILSDLLQAEDGSAIAERILEALQPKFEVEGHQLHVTASIGMAMYPEDGTTAELLLKHADSALYQAKAEGRNGYTRFSKALSQESKRNFVLDTLLHGALERQELKLYYQPQLDTASDRITHVEALVRWFTPAQGWISPTEFISRAEHNGLIVSLGEWILRQACRQTQTWLQAGISVTVSVNLSPRQLQHPCLVEQVVQILAETGLPPQALELEITESVALENLELSCDRSWPYNEWVSISPWMTLARVTHP